MKVISFKEIVGILINEGYLKGENFIENIKPIHGNCYTCQICSQNHDDCVCDLNRLSELIRKFSVYSVF